MESSVQWSIQSSVQYTVKCAVIRHCMLVLCSHGSLLHLPPTLDVTAVNLKNNSNLMHYCVSTTLVTTEYPAPRTLGYTKFLIHNMHNIVVHMHAGHFDTHPRRRTVSVMQQGWLPITPGAVVIHRPCVSSIKGSQLPAVVIHHPCFQHQSPLTGFLKHPIWRPDFV